jgi:hypothetical protein
MPAMVSVSEPSERVDFPAPIPAMVSVSEPSERVDFPDCTMVSAAFIPELPPERIDFPDRIPTLVMDTFVPDPTERLDSPLALVLVAFIIR